MAWEMKTKTCRRLWCSMVASPLPGDSIALAAASSPEHQAQRMVPRGNGLPNIQPRETPDHQRRKLDALRALDALHAAEMDNPQVDAAIKNWELAFRMQAEVPDLMELANEPDC